MKLFLIIYSGPSPDHISALLDAHEAGGYTELANARGAGATGRLLGTRAWPGSATVFLSSVPSARVAELRQALAAYRDILAEGEHLHAMILPIEDAF